MQIAYTLRVDAVLLKRYADTTHALFVAFGADESTIGVLVPVSENV